MSTAHEIDGKVFDYVVCGGGTAGCVVAGRLAEDPNVRVLVVEAGQDNAGLENTQMPGGWSRNFDGETDWNIVTEPMPGVDGRQVKCSRGRFLGGCSGCNGTLCIRGTKQCFDDWGIEGWGGDEMFEYMAKTETFHPKDWFKEDPRMHGSSGPLHTEPHDLAPISKLAMESMADRGLPFHDDMFSTGKVAQGCGHCPRTVYGGLRTTGADFITKDYGRENVTILTDATVDKVNLAEAGGKLRATSVDLVTKGGPKCTVRASKEIIISSGTYCSPAILLRSGIGPKAELDQLGIPCKVDLPGVGKNLQDHLIVFMFYEVSQEGLTNDHLVYHGDSLASTYALWKDQKAGFLSTFPFGAFAYARLDDRLADSDLWNSAPRQPGRDPMGLAPHQPNVEFWNTELYGGPKQYADFPINGQHVFGMICELFGARSRGFVKLRSKDPWENPVVDHKYLDDPLDMLVLSEGCRYANEIATQGKGTKGIVKGAWPKGASHHEFTEREQWAEHVKKDATTCYHAAGTCKMGNTQDPLAVLDERLRVHGVEGLRVADVSVMPDLNCGHTQMPAYAIGEKAADLIKESAKAS